MFLRCYRTPLHFIPGGGRSACSLRYWSRAGTNKAKLVITSNSLQTYQKVEVADNMIRDLHKQRVLFLLAGLLLLIIGALASSAGTLIDLVSQGYIRPTVHVMLIASLLVMCGLGNWLLNINPVWLLCYISIPMGLIWSIQEFISTISNLRDIDLLPNYVVNIMLPAFISGVACALAFFCMDEDTESNIMQDPSIPSMVLVSSVPFMLTALFTVTGLWQTAWLWGIHPALMLAGCLMLGVSRRMKTNPQKLRNFGITDIGFICLDGGKVTTFMGALVVALFYIAFSRLNDPKTIGPIMALGMVTILLGCLVYLIGICLSAVSCSPETQRNMRLDSWHLAEAYGFVLLATLAPASIFELI